MIINNIGINFAGGGGGGTPAVLTAVTFTDNDTYTPGEGVDGWSAVTVNVPTVGGNRLNMLLNNQLTALTSSDLSGVTEIKQSFAQNCTNLVSVNIPSAVTSIGSYAFSNTSLTGLTLPSGISSIGDSAFYSCTGITGSLNLSQYTDLRSISSGAFAGCTGITSLTLPPNLETLGSSAFDNISISGEVVIPAGVSSIEDGVFSRTSVSKLTYMGAISGIGWAPWYDLPNLAVIDLTHNFRVLEMSNFDVFNYIDPNFEIWVPDALYSNWLSAWTESYSSIDWSEHLVSKPSPYGNAYVYYTTNDGNPVDFDISDYNYNPADWGMAVVVSNVYDASTGGTITFYGNLTKIRGSFLSDKPNLVSVTIPSGVTILGDSFCQSCSNLETVSIPSGVTTLGNYFCQYCSNIETVSLPSTITDIGNYTLAFSGIKTFTVPPAVTQLQNSVLYRCGELTSATISSGVTQLDGFNEVSSLTEVTIEAPGVNIAAYTFTNTRSLEKITFTTSTPPTGSNSNVFSFSPETGTIYVPAGSLAAYEDWKNYMSGEFGNWTIVEV